MTSLKYNQVVHNYSKGFFKPKKITHLNLLFLSKSKNPEWQKRRPKTLP